MQPLKILAFFLCFNSVIYAQDVKTIDKISLIDVGEGWAKNSVNANILRRNSIASYKNVQYIAYYNEKQQVVIGKRIINSKKWDLRVTKYLGKASDAHRIISITVDGDGYLHISWDHHVNKLRYCKSIAPGSLELTDELPMTGLKEQRVTYPEFYNLPSGDLLFLYRDGSSGDGSMVLNRYNLKTKSWNQLQDGWINGENERSPYWQMAIDKFGTIHISWVWRESPDVSSNHDLCYAKSTDGGITWEKASGEKYNLPITAKTAEYALKIPEMSELINTTSITTDNNGRPYTVTYWRKENSQIPQYHIVYYDGNKWVTNQISNRVTPFTLSGKGTKRIPISRPQLILNDVNGVLKAVMIYRDIEQNDKVSILSTDNIKENIWQLSNLTKQGVSLWEPSYDTNLWQNKRILNLFVQKVEQGDAETIEDIKPQNISVLQWKPKW